jgi:hypothetical protein
VVTAEAPHSLGPSCQAVALAESFAAPVPPDERSEIVAEPTFATSTHVNL